MDDKAKSAVDLLYEWLDTLPVTYRILYILVATAVTIIIAKIVVKIATHFINKLVEEKESVTSLMGGFMINTIRVLIWIIAAVTVLGLWGIDLAPILAGVGVSGIVFGLALQETIASIFSGFMIAVTKPFKIGDYVSIGSNSGTVTSMDTVAVGLKTPDGKKIVMANKLVWGSVITNFTSNRTRRVDMVINAYYDADVDKIKSIAKEVLSTYDDVLDDPAPLVEVGEYADSFMKIYIRPFCKNKDYWNVKFRFQADFPQALIAAGVKIPYNVVEVISSEEK